MTRDEIDLSGLTQDKVEDLVRSAEVAKTGLETFARDPAFAIPETVLRREPRNPYVAYMWWSVLSHGSIIPALYASLVTSFDLDQFDTIEENMVDSCNALYQWSCELLELVDEFVARHQEDSHETKAGDPTLN